MNHGSLFSGIGGFDLAAQWMGWENIFHCEWMPFPRQVLHHYWPNAISYEDITKTDFTIHRGQIDILTGGFPCQPYSNAGKRLGKDDERHLWPEMLRAVREIEPTYIVGENVRGLTNWNGGVVFEEVCTDLESCGYQVQPILLPAAAVNAPHRRDRVWFIAYNNRFRCNQRKCNDEINTRKGGIYAFDDIDENDGQGNASDTDSNGLQGGIQSGCNDKQEWNRQKPFIAQHLYPFGKFLERQGWKNFPTKPPVCGGDDGLPTELDGITFPKWRAESIKGYGNAIVPQVALQIFKTIQQLHDNQRTIPTSTGDSR